MSNKGNTSDLEVTEGAIAVGRRGPNLYVLSCLLLVAAIFAIGAWSWVSFYRASGSSTGLFTQTDFPAVTIVSRMISEGRGAEMYNLDAQLEGQRRLIAEGYMLLSPGDNLKYPYPYTPPIAILLAPFAGLPPTTGMAVWDIINIGCMAWGFWFLLSSLALARFTRLVLLLGALTSIPFIVNLEQGQSSGVVMLGLGLGIGLLKRGRDLPAGLAFGLLLLKIQWLPVLAIVLIYKRRWRTLVGMAATGSAMLLVIIMVMGVGWLPDYLQLLGRAQQYARELLLDPWYSHSFPGGLTALLGRGTDDIVRLANLGATVGLVVVLLFLWRERWEPSNRRWDGLVAATLLVAFFTNLQLNTHDLCLLALPGSLGLSYLSGLDRAIWKAKAAALWLGTLWMLYVATGLFLPQVFSLPLRISTVAIGLMLGVMIYALKSEQFVAGKTLSR